MTIVDMTLVARWLVTTHRFIEDFQVSLWNDYSKKRKLLRRGKFASHLPRHDFFSKSLSTRQNLKRLPGSNCVARTR